jgi:hypothetical protein
MKRGMVEIKGRVSDREREREREREMENDMKGRDRDWQ